MTDAEQAQALAQAVAEEVQVRAHSRIAFVVTRCLRAVYGEGAYEFRVIFEQKRGRTEARLVFVDSEGEELDPTYDTEGGALDVASFALRLVCLMMTRPAPRRFVALDEPFRFVDDSHIDSVRELLLALADELGFQFLVITHDRGLCAGTVVELEK